jgi:hypothetical protein
MPRGAGKIYDLVLRDGEVADVDTAVSVTIEMVEYYKSSTKLAVLTHIRKPKKIAFSGETYPRQCNNRQKTRSSTSLRS